MASCGGYHLEDLQAMETYETDWRCLGSGAGGASTDSLVVLWHWLNETPAGGEVLDMMSVPRYAGVLKPEFFIIVGDVAMSDMHDGHYYPIGCETPFLDSFPIPWRYDRLPNLDEKTTDMRGMRIFYLLGERLLRLPGDEENYPRITSATAETNGRQFRVTAQVETEPEAVHLWWNHSEHRAYVYEHGQGMDWQVVQMALQPDGSYQSPWITDLPDGHEAAWYVDATVDFSIATYNLFRRDSSPVRFLFRNPEGTCEGLEVPKWCD
jgi:hypothetical protein